MNNHWWSQWFIFFVLRLFFLYHKKSYYYQDCITIAFYFLTVKCDQRAIFSVDNKQARENFTVLVFLLLFFFWLCSMFVYLKKIANNKNKCSAKLVFSYSILFSQVRETSRAQHHADCDFKIVLMRFFYHQLFYT